jgi:hypothetical protein
MLSFTLLGTVCGGTVDPTDSELARTYMGTMMMGCCHVGFMGSHHVWRYCSPYCSWVFGVFVSL